MRARHDLLIVEAPAFFLVSGPGAIDVGSFPKSVRTAYDRVRHLRDVSRHFLSTYPRKLHIVHRIETSASALASNVLRPLVRRYPRPTLHEYEEVLDDAVRQVRGVTGTQLVLLGPSGFNPDQPSSDYPADALKIYENVNAMVKQVAASHGLPMVDRMEVVRNLNSSIYLPGWQRYSVEGHRVTGNLLAEWLLRNGLA